MRKFLKKAGGDIKLALQSYNFGPGFIDYAKARGGYSKEVAIEFSHMEASRLGWSSYGDVDYVDHVLQYYQGSTESVLVGNFPAGGQSFDVNAVHNIMRQYLGWPYVWGGRSPGAGGFDCSGLIEYAFGKIGKNLSGDAQTQFDKTVPVPESQIKPGDLVFFSTYKAGPSHVGMYVGNGQFINSNNSGVQYSSVDAWKKLYPFLGFRRVK
ncbi:NlpC/P60 family protein [Aneurinibacillus terranovensis]|uniref:C40 family peptidase n=1 Tax=Aneurinibacillus terranovensis TaxID=278991 RepID=UPI0003FBF965|nr:C40 family peptidase [Aneurinibacillus terranovensis]